MGSKESVQCGILLENICKKTLTWSVDVVLILWVMYLTKISMGTPYFKM